MAAVELKKLPSERWTSLDGWDYGGMKQRLESFLATLDKFAIVRHAERVLGQKLQLSQPFSAGQYWVCFELVAAAGELVIARVRLPRHPDAPRNVDEQTERYAIDCEVAAMRHVRQLIGEYNLHSFSLALPELYAYAGPDSDEAAAAGAAYMLIEGFHGNTIQDIEFDMTQLPFRVQEHIITQWTAAQAALAIVACSRIGSISTAPPSHLQTTSLSTAPLDGLARGGPFTDAKTYFMAIGRARYNKASEDAEGSEFAKLATYIFLDIVQKTELFTSRVDETFPISHMDMGTQNILVDNDFNFLAIIDWEFAQAAPWQVHHYPMPFPLIMSDADIDHILADLTHVARANVVRQTRAQKLYRQTFKAAEEELTRLGLNRLNGTVADSIADALDGPASRIYACLERLEGYDENDEPLAHEMVRLAFNLDENEMNEYIRTTRVQMESENGPASPGVQRLGTGTGGTLDVAPASRELSNGWILV